MSDSESQSVNSGNAFSGEGASSTDSSESRSCSSATEDLRLKIMFEHARRGFPPGEDIEPLDSIPYKKSARGSSSAPPTDTGLPKSGGVNAETEAVEVESEVEVEVEETPVDAEVEGPVGFAVDRLRLSASTEEDLVTLREAFNIPASVTMRLPEKGELRSASMVPGETLVHPFFFGEGLRIPLPAYQQKFLAEVGLAISQLNPNTWRCLNGLYTLYHHCGFGEPDLAVFFNQWVLEEHSRTDKGWYKLRSALKPCAECPRDTELMDFTHKYKVVTRCCLKKEALEREGMTDEHDVESHEFGSPEIARDPLVYGNPTSQQTWKNKYFFIGGEWEFPAGSEVPAKRVPCNFREAPGC